MTQRDNLQQTSVVNTKEELFELLLSPLVEISDMYFVNDKTAWISWKYTEDAAKSIVSTESRNLSLITGAYTTAHGRLRLYEELYRLGDRMLYCDTDSVIYIDHIDDPIEYKPKLGSNIGELTDEISKYKKGGYVSEFVSVGPKSYSLRIKNTEDDEVIEISKLKGFICTEASKKQLSFENYKKMVFGCDNIGVDSHTIYSDTNNINRKKYFKIVTVEQQKRFGFTFDKRVVINDFKTIPYGFLKK